MSVPSHILTWADKPGVAPLLRELRSRRERGQRLTTCRVEVGSDAATRSQIGQMLPSKWASSGKPVSLRELRAGLAEHGVELDDLLIAVGGALRDAPAERRAARAARQADRDAGLHLLRSAKFGDDEAVLQRVLASADSWETRAGEVLTVMAAVRPGERLGVLAARLFGDAHALDRTSALGRAVARFAMLKVATDTGQQWQDPLSDAGLWHGAWAGSGVVCDRVSAQVLVLNLPLTGDAPAARLCAATPGEPVWLSLRSLTGELTTDADEVFVCENPAILEEAADRFGVTSRPLVCTFGLPNQATFTLLRALDADLYVRADGDATGWRIVRMLLDRFPRASLWRMPPGATQYEEELLEKLLSDLAP